MIPIRTAFLSALLPLAGCSSHYGYTHIRMGNAFVEQSDGGPARVAWYHGGEIRGAEALADPAFPLHAWLDGREAVDHPELARWRRQLADLRATAAGTGSAIDLVRAAVGFPFKDAVAESCSLWVGNKPARAAELLDCAGDIAIDDAFAERLAVLALAAGPGDERAASWVHALTEAGCDEAVVALATNPAAGARTAQAALRQLGELSSQHRGMVFAAAARRVQADAAMAWSIVAAAEELPSHDESPALAALLDNDGSTELARQILRQLGDRPAGDRAMLFARAAARICSEPRSQFAVAESLREVPAAQRFDAARAVVARADAPVPLVVLLVDGVEHLRSSDREAFLCEVLDGPHGAARDVREACADAARRHLSSRARERVLVRLGGGSR
jgi:hypothetical protein